MFRLTSAHRHDEPAPPQTKVGASAHTDTQQRKAPTYLLRVFFSAASLAVVNTSYAADRWRPRHAHLLCGCCLTHNLAARSPDYNEASAICKQAALGQQRLSARRSFETLFEPVQPAQMLLLCLPTVVGLLHRTVICINAGADPHDKVPPKKKGLLFWGDLVWMGAALGVFSTGNASLRV